ncbi:hypothetical protein [Burkholderia ubonensis]|uniref:hypothetical protein n=1 Tax=Burkholderia ubonensis TaxID=101571 RepID=UPI000B295C31|nr:hypothetical protein [Burkholderia ubonensis]
MSRNVGCNIGAIAADAVVSTVGNMVVDQVQGASVGKTNATPMHPDDARFLDAFAGAFRDVGNAPSSYASSGMLFAGPGAPSPDVVNITASGATSGLSALYGTGYGAEFDNGLYLDPRLNLNEAAFRSAMSGTETGIGLAQTDGGFWRGLAGDTRNVFETPAPLSEKIGSGVRAVGALIADPLIELGNQYRDVFSAASGATGGWRSAFAQQVSDGSYSGAALTELCMVAGVTPMAGAALKGGYGPRQRLGRRLMRMRQERACCPMSWTVVACQETASARQAVSLLSPQREKQWVP